MLPQKRNPENPAYVAADDPRLPQMIEHARQRLAASRCGLSDDELNETAERMAIFRLRWGLTTDAYRVMPARCD